MNKHIFAPQPLPMLHGRPQRQSASSGVVWRKLVPALLPCLAAAFMATQFVPHYGEAVSGLFSQVAQGLTFALDRR